MIRIATLSALLLFVPLAPAVVSAQTPPALSLEQTSTIRCAAAFALVADGQARGNEAALAYPPMADRGREFFVRASAHLMDQTGMSRADVAAVLGKEAQDIWGKGVLDTMMPPCLIMLAASGV